LAIMQLWCSSCNSPAKTPKNVCDGNNYVCTNSLCLQVQNVVARVFLHKDNLRVYIEHSGNWWRTSPIFLFKQPTKQNIMPCVPNSNVWLSSTMIPVSKLK
jgi:hypothetical protein